MCEILKYIFFTEIFFFWVQREKNSNKNSREGTWILSEKTNKFQEIIKFEEISLTSENKNIRINC